MSLAFETLDIFFADFAVECIKPDSSVIQVILDMPESEFLSGLVVNADIRMTAKASDVSDLNEQDSLTINGASYVVRKVLNIGDGAISEVQLSESTP